MFVVPVVGQSLEKLKTNPRLQLLWEERADVAISWRFSWWQPSSVFATSISPRGFLNSSPHQQAQLCRAAGLRPEKCKAESLTPGFGLPAPPGRAHTQPAELSAWGLGGEYAEAWGGGSAGPGRWGGPPFVCANAKQDGSPPCGSPSLRLLLLVGLIIPTWISGSVN